MTDWTADPPREAGQVGGSFLAEASRLLAASLEYEETLATVARLSLPHLGDWCIVDLCRDGRMRRAAVIHRDPDMQALARRLESGWPPEQNDPLGAPRAVRTRKTEIIPEIPDDMLVQVARSDEILGILRKLRMGSLLLVPLQARGDVLGAITYVGGERSHDPDDVPLAEDLAARCAMALDNARLYLEAVGARSRAEEALAAADAARREAELANDAKSEFLRTISHELRTPLNAISAYVELLEMGVHGPLTEQQMDDLSRIQINHKHLHSLVTQVLDYAQIGAGHVNLHPADVALSAVLERLHAVLDPLARRSEVSLPAFEGCLPPDVVVRADAQKLSQILVNLMSNAVKFTPAGGRVDLTCDVVDAQVRVHVHDTGSGIARGDQERIFDPFVQLSQGLSRTSSGTGLGLAITRELARLMGGDVTVRSEPGKGSTFSLSLPAAGVEVTG